MFKYLETSDGVVAGKDPALLSSHHGLMGGCTQIYCFLLTPPAAHTFVLINVLSYVVIKPYQPPHVLPGTGRGGLTLFQRCT